MDDIEMGELLQSMKGVGPIISAVFLGEVGDISRFSNWYYILQKNLQFHKKGGWV